MVSIPGANKPFFTKPKLDRSRNQRQHHPPFEAFLSKRVTVG
jgi:hypothetical protein